MVVRNWTIDYVDVIFYFLTSAIIGHNEKLSASGLSRFIRFENFKTFLYIVEQAQHSTQNLKSHNFFISQVLASSLALGLDEKKQIRAKN